jgi:hypothetical protein
VVRVARLGAKTGGVAGRSVSGLELVMNCARCALAHNLGRHCSFRVIGVYNDIPTGRVFHDGTRVRAAGMGGVWAEFLIHTSGHSHSWLACEWERSMDAEVDRLLAVLPW